MEIIVYIDEDGTQEGECDYRAIYIREPDIKNVLTALKNSLNNGEKFNIIHVLSEHEYQKLLKLRDTHPDYIEYETAKNVVKKFEERFIRI